MIIVSAVVTKISVTLYTNTGESLRYLQGDYLITQIVDEVLPEIEAGRSVEFIPRPQTVRNAYSEYEEKSGGIKLFSMAKKLAAKLFGTNSEPKDDDVPIIPEGTYGQDIDNILASEAISVSDSKFDITKFHSADDIDLEMTNDNSKHDTSDETIVAIKDGKAVAGIERLHNHITHSVDNNNTSNITAFIGLLTEFIGNRKHSIDDLLRFLENGDIPIAEDGYVIGYKSLANHPSGDYCDIHTRKISQRVGDIVRVPEKLVDDNRRRDCSNGLHFARRGYLRTFKGDACALVRIHPLDFIAVPEGYASKCRVSAYQIVHMLSQESYNNLLNNRPISKGTTDYKVLSEVLKGNVPSPLREVLITKHNGEGIVYTDLVQEPNTTTTSNKPHVDTVEVTTEPVTENCTIAPVAVTETKVSAPVKVKEIKDTVKAKPKKKTKTQPKKKKASSEPKYSAKAQILALASGKLTPATIAAIHALRKKQKKSLKALGVPDEHIKRINEFE